MAFNKQKHSILQVEDRMWGVYNKKTACSISEAAYGVFKKKQIEKG